MPSTSAKQHRFMEAVKHNKKFAKKVGVPQSVGRDFVSADKATGKYGGGGKVTRALRLERLLDENPRLDKIMEPRGIDMLADYSDPIITLKPDEYMRLAARVAPNYEGVFRQESNKLGRQINSKSKLFVAPELRIAEDDLGPGVFKVTGHDGRHRAQILGDKGYNVPTFLSDENGIAPSLDALIQELSGGLLLPENHVGPGRLPLNLGDRAFAGGGRVRQTLTAVRKLGAKIGYNPDTREFRVTVPGVSRAKAEAMAYYDSDPESVVSTAKRMLQEAQAAGIDTSPRIKLGDKMRSIPIDMGPDTSPGKYDDFINRILDETIENPLDRHSRVMKDYSASFDPSRWLDTESAYLTGLRSLRPGGGNKALNLLKSISDETNVPITGMPSVLPGTKGLDDDSLLKWYKLHGFEPDEGDLEMYIRKPIKRADGGSTSRFPSLEKMLTSMDDTVDDQWSGSPLVSADEQLGGEVLGHYLLKGLATNIGDLDEQGHVHPSWSGFADSIKSLAATPALLDLLLPRAPFKASKIVPQWAWDADERKGRVRERIAELTKKHGPNAFLDAAGEMVTQVPLPINALKEARLIEKIPGIMRPAARGVGAMTEYLSPTVDPAAGNYLKGTIAGTVFNKATDTDEGDSELERIMQEAEKEPPITIKPGGYVDRIMHGKFAGGGKVSKVSGIMHRIFDTRTKERIGEPYINRWDAEAKLHDLEDQHGEGRFVIQPVQGGTPEGAAAAEMRAMNRNAQLRSTLKPVGKAGGGKVTRTARAIKAIKDTISHLENRDRTSAIQALSASGLHDDPEIQEVIRLLRGPMPPTIEQRAKGVLNKAVTDDADTVTLPLMSP